MRLLTHPRASFRLLRGRCPSCGSEGPTVASCRSCHGYEGPFPPSEATRTRWAGRLAQQAQVAAPPATPHPAAHLSPAR